MAGTVSTPAPGDRTEETTSTDRSDEGASAGPPVRALAIVLDCDRPATGAGLHSLTGIDRVVIGRGSRRAFRRDGRAARLDLADAKASRDHTALVLGPHGATIEDLGSTNGTYLGEERVEVAELPPGAVFRTGRTLLAVVPDAREALARFARPGPAWPFATLSEPFARSLDRLERIAPSKLPILVLGETGSGKERLARAVHDRSGRPGAFVAVNCGAIPATLLESQLFGHKKGAFSGAVSDERGYVRAADRGTLFLDEIGDLPLVAQASLLRVLQEDEVTPLGASRPTKVELRVLAATHRSIADMVRAGTFREDLYARIAAFTFVVPPLRERKNDLGILVGALAPEVRLTTEAALALHEHDWPRNVRELGHVLTTAALLAKDGVVRRADLPGAIAGVVAPASSAPAGERPVVLSAEDRALRRELARRLTDSGGNITQVAREMGKARQQIQRWMRRFQL